MKPISYLSFIILTFLFFGCSIEQKLPAKTTAKETIIPNQKTTAKEEKIAQQKSKKTQNLSLKGEREYRRKNYKSAEKFFDKALSIDPENLHALTGIGWTLYDSRQFKKALVFFKKANNRYPKDNSAKRGLAYLFYRIGKLSEAEKLLGKLDRNKWPELTQIDLEKNSSVGEMDLNVKKTLFKKKGVSKYQGLGNKGSDLIIPQKSPGSNMVLITGGVFYFSTNKRFLKKKKRKKAKVKSFLMDKFEVTNSQYAMFVKSSGYPEPPFWDSEQFSGAHLPVVGVSWIEAKAFCSWVKKRLPTEIEWSYVAQGGQRQRIYPWGMKLKQRNAIFGLDLITGGPKAVGRRPQGASIHGVEDLAGNVWEWVQEKYNTGNKKIYSTKKERIEFRVLKGGSWANGSWALKNFNRTGDLANRKLPVYGFRCAKNNTN